MMPSSLDSISTSSDSSSERALPIDEEKRLQLDKMPEIHSHANQKQKFPFNSPEQHRRQISECPAAFSPLLRQVSEKRELHTVCMNPAFFFCWAERDNIFQSSIISNNLSICYYGRFLSSLEMHAAICAKNVYVNLPHTATSFIVSPKTLSINPLDSPSECASSRDRVRWLHHRLFGDFPRTASIKRHHN